VGGGRFAHLKEKQQPVNMSLRGDMELGAPHFLLDTFRKTEFRVLI
jgi:hypothetical protein